MLVERWAGDGNKKARPIGRAGLGAVVSNPPLGGHPDTCSLAATRGAVVEMHMVVVPDAHHGTKASRVRHRGQLLPGRRASGELL